MAFEDVYAIDQLEDDYLLTPKQAALLFGVAESTLSDWRIRGFLPKNESNDSSVRWRWKTIRPFLEAYCEGGLASLRHVAARRR